MRITTASELHFIDSHTGGEPTRVIHAGFPELKGSTMAEKRNCLGESFDWIRSASVNEPRGSDAVVGALLLPPLNTAHDAAVIFFNNVGYINMCVHGTIGLAVTLAHMGRLAAHQTATIETPVGNVQASLGANNRVTVANVPSYRSQINATVEVDVPGHGAITGDVAWGGNWFFLIDQHKLRLELSNIPQLTAFCTATRKALAAAGITGDDGGEIDHIEVFAPPRAGMDADSQNFVLCPGGAYDRSPCGTGTSAKLACLHASGKLAPGDIWRQASIVGSVFEGAIVIESGAVIPQISGTAFVTGEGRLLLDPADPFAHGIAPAPVA
ncbi:MAG: 4-hydroxyproline epimerase [Verrucomicrobiales bacterium]|jgi:4-hydroxyproline epimerase